MPSQTSGEARPVTPVQPHSGARCAVATAPRFRKDLRAVMQTGLSASCSQGLPKPVGEARTLLEFGGVGETLQDGIVAGRFEELEHGRENAVQPGRSVPDV